jgi:hypothetical protein
MNDASTGVGSCMCTIECEVREREKVIHPRKSAAVMRTLAERLIEL